MLRATGKPPGRALVEPNADRRAEQHFQVAYPAHMRGDLDGARRHEPRHYPHVNLTRVHVKRGLLDAAIAELRRALTIVPHYRLARTERRRFLALLN